MDNDIAIQLFYIAAGLLGIIIWLLIMYLIIRLAVTHALRSHEYWKHDAKL